MNEFKIGDRVYVLPYKEEGVITYIYRGTQCCVVEFTGDNKSLNGNYGSFNLEHSLKRKLDKVLK